LKGVVLLSKFRFSHGCPTGTEAELTDNSLIELILLYQMSFGVKDCYSFYPVAALDFYQTQSILHSKELSASYFNACQPLPLCQISSNEQHPGSSCSVCVSPQPSTLCLISTSH
jgi:hypothetical protein